MYLVFAIFRKMLVNSKVVNVKHVRLYTALGFFIPYDYGNKLQKRLMTITAYTLVRNYKTPCKFVPYNLREYYI